MNGEGSEIMNDFRFFVNFFTVTSTIDSRLFFEKVLAVAMCKVVFSQNADGKHDCCH